MNRFSDVKLKMFFDVGESEKKIYIYVDLDKWECLF